MHPINSFKKWLLTLLVQYVEVTKKGIKNEPPKHRVYY